MDNFSWLSSVIIPAVVSLIPTLLAYIVGGRREKSNQRNALIDQVNTKLDKVYLEATRIFKIAYADEDYHYMVYEFDGIMTNLEKLDNELAKFELSTLKRLLTDIIFYQKENNNVMQTLSKQIHKIKKNLQKSYW